jgi:hypothetical protein
MYSPVAEFTFHVSFTGVIPILKVHKIDIFLASI